jgi:hypothetical protein
MRQSTILIPVRIALVLGVFGAALFLALSGTAGAATQSPPPTDSGSTSIELAPPAPDTPVIDQAEPTHAAESDNDLPAGAWLGIAVALAFAVLLLVGSLAYILPKPPGR